MRRGKTLFEVFGVKFVPALPDGCDFVVVLDGGGRVIGRIENLGMPLDRPPMFAYGDPPPIGRPLIEVFAEAGLLDDAPAFSARVFPWVCLRCRKPNDPSDERCDTPACEGLPRATIADQAPSAQVRGLMAELDRELANVASLRERLVAAQEAARWGPGDTLGGASGGTGA